MVLCWLITDFSTDQNAQINTLLHVVAAAPPFPTAALQPELLPSYYSFLFHSAQGVTGILHKGHEGWAIPEIWLSNSIAVCALPPLPIH